jgi:hypothetical protein
VSKHWLLHEYAFGLKSHLEDFFLFLFVSYKLQYERDFSKWNQNGETITFPPPPTFDLTLSWCARHVNRNQPLIGLGVYKSGEATKQAVLHALRTGSIAPKEFYEYTQPMDLTMDACDTGYRHIDTAAAYNNEVAVGEAIREAASFVSRDEVTTRCR